MPLSSPPRSSLASPLLLILISLASCSEEPAATVQLVLTPDPALGSVEEVLAQVETIQVLVDAPGGLRGVDHAGPLESGGTAEDWDGDGELEVRFETAAPAAGELPVLEIGLSDNSGRELSFIVLGYPPGAGLDRAMAAAAGAASSACPPGESHKVGIPFNLKASHRPPRVILILPADGTEEKQFNLTAVTAVLSTTVTEASVADHVRVTDASGAVISTTFKVETLIAAAGGAAQERRSLLTLSFAESLEPEQYRVAIGPGIISDVGRRFDQEPGTPEEEGFLSRFTFTEGSVGGGQPCDSCPPGYGCEAGVGGCVPLMSCSAGCQTGFVCDEGQPRCVEDCRVLGVCADPTLACSQDSGLCQ